jgi:hypothetical protein
MGYFEAIAASSFTTDGEGRHLFFPWGVFGRGYVVPTEDDYLRLRATLIRTYQIIIPATVAPIALFGRWMAWVAFGLPFILLVAFIIGYPIWIRRVTSDWSISAERLSIRQSLANGAQHQSRLLLWFLLTCSLGFVAGGFLEIAKLPHWYVGTLTVLFFGFCAVVSSWMLVVRRRAQKTSGIGPR